MNQVHDAALYRLDTLERLIRESGSPVPPPSPLPMLHLQSSTSPIPPPSPFGMQTAPSLGLAYIPYPSPGMYPSPILHPYHYAQPSNSRKLMRRSSNGELNGNDSVGALSSGQLMPSRQPSGAYPSIGSGTMPLGSPAIRVPSPSSLREGQSSAADLRRLSIESSVLKKKIKPKSGSESGESSSNRAGSEPLIEANESLEGLGFVVEGADGNRLATISVPNVSSQGNSNSGEGSTSSSSHPASPSPQPRSHILVTPATADPFHRNGTHTFDSPALAPHLNGIKVVIDNEQGNLYFRDDQSPSREPSPLFEGEKIGEEKREYSEPVFASLAHTPEQLREIARMREDAVRAQRGRKRLSEVTGVGVVVAPLTPSLGQSPMPLNRE